MQSRIRFAGRVRRLVPLAIVAALVPGHKSLMRALPSAASVRGRSVICMSNVSIPAASVAISQRPGIPDPESRHELVARRDHVGDRVGVVALDRLDLLGGPLRGLRRLRLCERPARVSESAGGCRASDGAASLWS
jgi:hypothetical protein